MHTCSPASSVFNEHRPSCEMSKTLQPTRRGNLNDNAWHVGARGKRDVSDCAESEALLNEPLEPILLGNYTQGSGLTMAPKGPLSSTWIHIQLKSLACTILLGFGYRRGQLHDWGSR